MRRYRKISSIVVLIVSMVCGWNFEAAAGVGFWNSRRNADSDQSPFKDEYDSNFLVGGVLELDSNLGVVLEATVEYFQHRWR